MIVLGSLSATQHQPDAATREKRQTWRRLKQEPKSQHVAVEGNRTVQIVDPNADLPYVLDRRASRVTGSCGVSAEFRRHAETSRPPAHPRRLTIRFISIANDYDRSSVLCFSQHPNGAHVSRVANLPSYATIPRALRRPPRPRTRKRTR